MRCILFVLLLSGVAACSGFLEGYDWLALDTEERTEVLLASRNVEKRFIQLDGYRLAFVELVPERWNPRRRSLGDAVHPPWLIVHGIGGSMGDNTMLIPAHLKGRVVLVNLPGYGGSESEHENYTIGGAIDALAQFVDQLHLGGAHFICHSLGGHACIGVLLKNPGFAKSFTLISPSGVYDTAEFIREVHEGYAGINASEVPRLVGGIFDGARSGFDYEPLKWFVGYHPKRVAAFAVVTDSFRDRLHELRMPTLIMWGVDDPLFPLEDAYYMHSQIPRSTVRVAPIDHHSPQMTHPAEAARWVEEFIGWVDVYGELP